MNVCARAGSHLIYTMVKIIRSIIALVALAAALRAADSGPTPVDTLTDLVARQRTLFADAEKNQGTPEFDHENFKSQLQQLSDAYSVLLRDHPDFTEARVDYGQMLWKIDMRKEAVIQLLEANRLDKDIPVVKNLLGNYLAEDGRPVEALPYFMAAIKLAPREPLYHYNLGTLLYSARDDFLKEDHWTRAALDHSMIEAFRRAAELAPDRIDYTYRYANAFYDLATPDWENALKAWRALELQAKPGLELQFLQLQEATVLLNQKKPDAAGALLDGITEPKLAQQKQKLVAQLPPKPAK
jgi:tetratricopeptide (TPR) repeat protein